ncbi:MAG: hypothetical protein KGD68_13470, partial [Candidatus Lokiarchaeota archaeon]|nr:hypothetical protein [Candidatus Lokiarchaeota archaeon]
MIILNSHLRRTLLNKLIFILLLAVFCSTFFLTSGSKYYQPNTFSPRNVTDLPSPSSASIPIFEGYVDSLNITDYGNLYKYDQEVSLTNQEEVNLTYYLDDINSWKISTIKNKISNMQDTRNWANN